MSDSSINKIKAIQGILGVKQDGIPGPVTESAWDRLKESDPKNEWHLVEASSFADPQDVAVYHKWRAYYIEQGHSRDVASHMALAKGDNGVGVWGDDTTTDIPMVALPPRNIRERWGTPSAGRNKLVILKANGNEVNCRVADEMPNSDYNKRIDCNPGAAKVLQLKPPFLVPAQWKWGEQPQ